MDSIPVHLSRLKVFDEEDIAYALIGTVALGLAE